jgi:hypothetical protein
MNKMNSTTNVVAPLSAQSSSSLPRRLMDCFYSVCYWFSLPLSIWLTTGWIGLILHWQVLPSERPASWSSLFADESRSHPEFISAK